MSEAKQKKKMGAPTKKTPKLFTEICESIASGVSARATCDKLGISQKTLWNWLSTDADFLQQYARAKELCADVLAEEIIEIADDNSNDWTTGKDGHAIIDNEVVQRSRLRVDARKWYASKLAPKKYGDKITNEIAGDPDNPIIQNITVSFVPGNAQK